jgi:hypothetical protein
VGESRRGRLLGTVLPERIRLVLRLENEGSEPGRQVTS